jgi:hypothetical protein
MDGWLDGRMDGAMTDGCTNDGWRDGRMDGWMEELLSEYEFPCIEHQFFTLNKFMRSPCCLGVSYNIFSNSIMGRILPRIILFLYTSNKIQT